MGRRFDKPRRLTGGKTVQIVGWRRELARNGAPPTFMVAAVDLITRAARFRCFFANSGFAGSDRLVGTYEHLQMRRAARDAWEADEPDRPIPTLPPGTLALTPMAPSTYGYGSGTADGWSRVHLGCWCFDRATELVTVVGPEAVDTRGTVKPRVSYESEMFPRCHVLSAGRVKAVSVALLDAVLEPT